jgi:hypothetical protein
MAHIYDSETYSDTLVSECKRLGIPLKFIGFNEDIPAVLPRGAMIINLGSPAQGTHWTGLYKRGRRCWYFDSFGLPPPAEVKEACIWNPYVIQDWRGGGCGSYVIEFLQAMTEKVPFETFLHRFHEDPGKNRALLHEMERY